MMECPNCNGTVDITLLNIEKNADEDGVEVNYTCPGCRVESFAILLSVDFELVD